MMFSRWSHVIAAGVLVLAAGWACAAGADAPAATDAPYFGKRLEPQGRLVLHGAGQQAQEFETYYQAIGKVKPVIHMSYTSLNRCSVERFAQLKATLEGYPDSYLIPQIGLSMTRDGTPEAHYEQDVAAGKYDEQIETLCAGLRLLNRPVFLRIGYEFNGPWNGYQPETYRAAWVRVVKALRAHGLDEVATVWCYASDPRTKDVYMSYYPGDAYVDWWAIDLFDASHFTNEDTRCFMQDALAHGFPVMIGESTPRRVGVLEGEESWRKWYDGYFAFIRRYPQVKAFCYISSDWGKTRAWADWGNSRIGDNPVVQQRFTRELADPLFVNGGEERAVRRALGLQR